MCENYAPVVRLPETLTEIQSVMSGFKSLAGLPYCCGSIDGSHVRWNACPAEQYLDYKCYKHFPSLLIFAVSDAHRRFRYVDVDAPGVYGDSTLFEISKLNERIKNGSWLGPEIPSLYISDTEVRPYLLGDCAFTLNENMMKTTTLAQQRRNPRLRIWERVASKTRNPVECAFGILKGRFSVLKSGLNLHHEDDAARCMLSCVILHNICVDAADTGDEFIEIEENCEEIISGSTSNSRGLLIRDALISYLEVV